MLIKERKKFDIEKIIIKKCLEDKHNKVIILLLLRLLI